MAVAHGHVFLGEAVRKIGEALFPDEWTGNEPQVSRQPATANASQVVPTRTIGRRSRPSKQSQADASVDDPAFLKMLADARHEFAARYGYNTVALQRLATVQGRIVAEGMAGTLEFATRPLQGGATKPLPAIVWQTEQSRWANQFAFCQINPSDPFGLGIAGSKFEYLFVTSDSLKRLLETMQRRAASAKAVGARTTGEAACEDWLADEVKKSPERPPKPRDAYKDEALSKFPGISTNGFTRAWTKATQKYSERDSKGRAFWNKGGPRNQCLKDTT